MSSNGITTIGWSLARRFATGTSSGGGPLCEKASGSIGRCRGHSFRLTRWRVTEAPQTNSYTRKFLLNSPWQRRAARYLPARCATRASWYDRFMIRLIMKMTGGETDTRKEVVYTDWQQVSRFARNRTNGAQIARKTRVVMENRANEKFLHFPCHLRITLMRHGTTANKPPGQQGPVRTSQRKAK
ncbi:hypothetical protein J4734_08885 [Klebsiella pneumoniae]|uniref:Flavodoxin domain-containing protein n=1 Tax=Klebsiella pneumoniae TaxID=573 RepID=A0A939SUH0_KLEPN|nr:hypothetical protein [Klebsiella pneumoniae]